MRSPAQISQAVMLFVLLALSGSCLSGCQLNRSFFQMDSNSRVPFFGVDLAPKWPKRESAVDGVSRLQSEATAAAANTEARESLEPSTRPLALPLSDSLSEPVAVDTAPVETFR